MRRAGSSASTASSNALGSADLPRVVKLFGDMDPHPLMAKKHFKPPVVVKKTGLHPLSRSEPGFVFSRALRSASSRELQPPRPETSLGLLRSATDLAPLKASHVPSHELSGDYFSSSLSRSISTEGSPTNSTYSSFSSSWSPLPRAKDDWTQNLLQAAEADTTKYTRARITATIRNIHQQKRTESKTDPTRPRRISREVDDAEEANGWPLWNGRNLLLALKCRDWETAESTASKIEAMTEAARGRALEQTDRHGNTPLHKVLLLCENEFVADQDVEPTPEEAARRRDVEDTNARMLELADRLIKMGSNLDAVNENRRTPYQLCGEPSVIDQIKRRIHARSVRIRGNSIFGEAQVRTVGRVLLATIKLKKGVEHKKGVANKAEENK